MTWNIGYTKVLRQGLCSHGSPYSFAFNRIIYNESYDTVVGARVFVCDDDNDYEWLAEADIGGTFEVGDQVWRLESVAADEMRPERDERPSVTIRRLS